MTNTKLFYDSPDQLVPVNVEFTAANGAGTDPGTVVLAITSPHGDVTVYTYVPLDTDPDKVVSDGDGLFHVWAELFAGDPKAPAGLWSYTWTGVGGLVSNGVQVITGSFRVLPLDSVSGLNRWYCSKEDLKSRLGIDPGDTDDDFEIQLAVQTVTDWITSYCGQYFYRVDEVRTYAPLDGPWTLRIDNVVQLNHLKLDYDGDGVYEVEWTLGTEFDLYRYPRNYNAFDQGVARPDNFIQVISPGGTTGGQWLPFIWPFSRQDRIQVDATWGWPDVPPNVMQASLILAADLFKAKDAPWGVAGIAEMGMVKVQSNPWVVELLRSYISGRGKVGV